MPARSGPILVIEDDTDVRDAIAAFLRSDGFVVMTAIDGRQALDVLAGGLAPALILLDFMMPHMDAVEFCRERARLRLALDSPVVVLSAASTDLARVVAQCGAAEALPKPFELDDLIRVAEKFARKEGAGRGR